VSASTPASGPYGEHCVTIGPHTLYLGDAYTIRPTLGWQDADVMDPPYDFNNSGGGKWRAARGASEQIIEEGLTEGFDHNIINSLMTGAVIVFCHGDQRHALEGFLKGNFHRTVLLRWIKDNPAPHRNKNYLADSEDYFHSWNREYEPVGDHHDMHRHVTAPVQPSKIYRHPTVKPELVMDKIMRNVNGLTVCDPFMGTGSTGVAAIKAGKIFTGIEHNAAHFETAVKRVTAAWDDRT
jgi:DNA methylase